MKLFKYELKYFNHGDWEWHTVELIDENIDKVRLLIDTHCLPEWRSKPYTFKDHKEDSLTIKELYEVTLPIITYGEL